MPTYQYVCEKCGDRLEVFQSFSDKPLRKHQGCGGALHKELHPAGVIFKGPGFYSTDSRSSKSTSKSTDSSSDGSKKKPSNAKTSKSSDKSDSSDS